MPHPRKAGASVFLALALAGVPSGPAPSGRKPPTLVAGLGTHHRPISTRSPRAQRYFDQGLRFVYGFNHDEAQRAFEHAATLDPTCGICWWGAALTLGPNINLPALPDRARAAWVSEQKALALASKASPVERALIEALAKRYSNPPPSGPDEQKALDAAYAEAMRAAAKRFPADLDVATLAAESLMDLRPWDLWTLKGEPQPGTVEIVTLLEGVLARNPRHPGANHYYVHAVEASPHPEKALEAARRLGNLMPAAGHIVHMPAHIYIRTGRYAESSEANRRAIVADRKYVEAEKPAGFYHMYVAHNHQFLWATTMIEGRSGEAIRAARNTVSAIPLAMLREMPGFDILLTYPPIALARFGRWEEILREPAPPAEFSFATGLWRYSRGVALAKLERVGEASAELTRLREISAKTPPEAMESLNSAVALLHIAEDSLAGHLALAGGQKDEAVRRFQAAVTTEDTLHYAEPPDWSYPVRHSLGAALLAAGRAREAESVYREDLRRNPENGWSLIGLARSLRAQKKTAEAAAAEKRFRLAWKSADVKVTASEF